MDALHRANFSVEWVQWKQKFLPSETGLIFSFPISEKFWAFPLQIVNPGAMENVMLYDRRPCQPLCRPPDKRDFMEYNPEKSANDFFKNYDPMVGIGTAAILMMFIVLLTVKSLVRWAIKQWRIRKYVKRRSKKGKKLVTIVTESAELAPPSQQQTLISEKDAGCVGPYQIYPNGNVV